MAAAKEKTFEGADCFLRVHCGAIERNLEALRGRTKSRIMAVVKHDGYGLSLPEYARLLTSCGIEELAVGTAGEALTLRASGIGVPILLLTPEISEDAAAELLRKGVMLTVGGGAQAAVVRRAAEATGIRPKVHVKIDTGLGRYGFDAGASEEIPAALDGMEVRGTYTHFSSPYVSRKTTHRQYECFMHTIKRLRALGMQPGALHCCASGGFLNYPEMHMDIVRLGSALIGRVPGASAHGLLPAAFLTAPVVSIREPIRATRMGYRGIVRAGRGRRIGVLAVAGAFSAPQAGRSAEASNLYALINGCRAKALGMLGLGALALDLTGIPCAEGDVATLEINPLQCAGFLRREFEYATEETPSALCGGHLPQGGR